jgi:hypothetical protein
MSVLNVLMSAVLFAGACVGHGFVVVCSLNQWYARPLRRRLLRAIKVVHALWALAGPVGFVALYGSQLRPTAAATPSWATLADFYFLACALIGLILLPLLSLVRWLQGVPAALESNHTESIDVARQLGYAPAGRGKYRPLTRLPGNQVFQVDLSVRTLQLPGLPAAWDGLTILHLSDLHLSGTPDKTFYQHVMDRCREWDPELVAVTGDIVDSPVHHRWILPVLGRLRWRVAALAVLGNHDLWHDPNLVRRRLRKLNFHVLGNGWETIEVRGQPMVVVGHEGPWFQPEPDLSGCPPGVFRLCLSHTPDNIRWAQRRQIDLMLAGHNHGGQIRLPGMGSLFVPSRYGRRYDCGTFHEPPTLLHVSRGLAGQEPLRYFCPPEATLLVLKCCVAR